MPRRSPTKRPEARSLAEFCFDAAGGDPIRALMLALEWRKRFGDATPHTMRQRFREHRQVVAA